MATLNAKKIFLWRDSVVYLGDSFDPDLHRHHAVQCCISITGKLKVRWDGVEQWQSCSAAIIGANVNHSIISTEGPVCLIYLEKSSNSYRTILDYHCTESSCQIRKEPLLLKNKIPVCLSLRLSKCLLNNVGLAAANELKEKCLRFFKGFISEVGALDPRISHLLNLLHQRPEQAFIFTGGDLAQSINLSESRMQHLFKQQVGIPIRRYILWAKLRYVIELALGGSTLTEAAHSGGFADSAHFSRTFRAMFGISPSLLVSSEEKLHSLFCD